MIAELDWRALVRFDRRPQQHPRLHERNSSQVLAMEVQVIAVSHASLALASTGHLVRGRTGTTQEEAMSRGSGYATANWSPSER
jgi:hypothetical protein